MEVAGSGSQGSIGNPGAESGKEPQAIGPRLHGGDDEKFLAAHAADGVVLPEGFLEVGCQSAEDLVTGLMATGVIDLFEMIDIAEIR